MDNDQIDLHVGIMDVFISLDQAVPCGLILNELITNAIKHAFPDGRKGRIEVELHSDSDKHMLIVKDNGVGIPKELKVRKPKTLGLELVNSLVDQLDGSMRVYKKDGTMFKISFPA